MDTPMRDAREAPTSQPAEGLVDAVGRAGRTGARRGSPIVLAEDDPTMRGLFASTLRRDGYEVIEASDGIQLLEHLDSAAERSTRRNPISLVITDVRMPGISGLDVLAVLRCGHWNTPVILLTAFPGPDVLREAADLGAAALIEKPVDLEILREMVALTLQRPMSPAAR
jgi:CheY-like chemotaxis protein